MEAILDHEMIEILDELEEEEDDLELPLPRRYLRDHQNPLEHYSDVQFLKRYRFSKNTVTEAILPLVQLQENRTKRGLPVPPILQILCALRFYATGSFQIVLGDLQKIDQSTVCRIIRRVSIGIAQNLRQFIRFPSTEEEYGSNRNLFYEIAEFPGVVGAMDCTHIPIQSPGGQFAELYRNRKGWMSLNVQLICGPQMEIMDIVSRWPGSTHDSRIFENSAIRQKFVDGRAHGILLGDNGYPQLSYLFTPILDQHVRTPAERSTQSIAYRIRSVITLPSLHALGIGCLKPAPAEHHDRKKVFIHPALMKSKFVFICHDATRTPLQPPYGGPYPVLAHNDKHFEVQTPSGKQTVSIDRLKPAFLLTDSTSTNLEEETH